MFLSKKVVHGALSPQNITIDKDIFYKSSLRIKSSS